MLDNICICKICGKELKTMHHLQKHNISAKDYYEKYLKKDDEGICLYCGKQTKYISLLQGYRQFCSCKCNIKYNKLCAEAGDNNVSKNIEVKKKISNTLKQKINNDDQYKNKLIKQLHTKKAIIKSTLNSTKTKNSNEFKTKCADKLTKKYQQQGLKLKIIETNDDFKKCECLKCNTQFVIKSNLFYVRKRLNEEICLNCNPIIKNFSRKEKSLLNYIKEIYKGTIIENDTNELDGKELDIWLPEKRIAFEFDGSYWHRDERCFEKQLKNEIFKKETDKIHKRDEIKNNLCKLKNIKLIRIKEFDWDNNKQNIQTYIKGLIYD